jgi:predicted molibdopterin-dependent oxidoreductase YjgC
MGADPARHATPEQLARLEALDFLVVQDLCLTETAKRASVVLPAVAYTEKDGTFTNTERAVQVVRRAMDELPGALPDWQILGGLANAFGLSWHYGSSVEILAEIRRTVPLYAGVSRRGLGKEGARWPFSVGENDANGKPTLVGSPHLTWDMVAHGVSGGAGGDEPAPSRTQGEQG